MWLASSTVPMNTQRPTGTGWQQIFLMGSIIAHFLESVLWSESEHYPTITSQIIMISHSALPLMASLHSRSGSIPHGSSSFSTTISLWTNASKRTTFFVLGSYLVQRSHGIQTPSSICLCENCLSLCLVCLHMMLSHTASSPSTPMSLLALVTFLLFLCSCIWKDTIPCVPVECARSKAFASQTRETRCSMCCCLAAIILRQPMLSSIIWRIYHCAHMISL